MQRRNFLILCAASIPIVGCSKTWETNYNNNVSAEISKAWHVSNVLVSVPKTLSVSESNLFLPDADIVWHGDPQGDRHEQVKQIFETAGIAATRSLRGTTSVDLKITVHSFHGITPKARKRLRVSGVHNISFDINVIKRSNGETLAFEQNVQADLPALVGQDAIDAEAAGQDQRTRVTSHLTQVIAGWLGTGQEDPRSQFQRIGR